MVERNEGAGYACILVGVFLIIGQFTFLPAVLAVGGGVFDNPLAESVSPSPNPVEKGKSVYFLFESLCFAKPCTASLVSVGWWTGSKAMILSQTYMDDYIFELTVTAPTTTGDRVVNAWVTDDLGQTDLAKTTVMVTNPTALTVTILTPSDGFKIGTGDILSVDVKFEYTGTPAIDWSTVEIGVYKDNPATQGGLTYKATKPFTSAPVSGEIVQWRPNIGSDILASGQHFRSIYVEVWHGQDVALASVVSLVEADIITTNILAYIWAIFGSFLSLFGGVLVVKGRKG